MATNVKNSNHKVKLKFNVYSALIIILFLSLILAELFASRSYLDEVIGILSAFYLLFFRSRMEKRDVITIVLLAVVSIYGLISNTVSGLTSNYFSIFVDVLAESKVLLSYFAVKYFLNDSEKQSTIELLTGISALFTIASFICGIISLFKDIGMSGLERYGIRSFHFIFDMEHQFMAVYMFIFAVLVCNTRMKHGTKVLFYIMAMISMILTTKAPPILFSIIFVGLSFYFRKHKKLSTWIIIIGIIMVIIVGQYQIHEYLLNENSPRHLFIKYAIKTANNYFPFGSGFATYGSDQAARVYSHLYYQYGFSKLNGMNPDNPAFLSDTFWPMAIGQFGWVGSILYAIVYLRVFLTLKNDKFSNEKRAFVYACYLQYMIHAIGSAILSSSAGMIGFMGLALVTELDESQEKSGRLKIHI